MNKVSLPDSAWAMLRDPDEVTERQRRPLVRLRRRAMIAAAPHITALTAAQNNLDSGDGEGSVEDALDRLAPALAAMDLDQLEDIDDLLIVTLVDSWSYELPVTVDGSLDLPSKARTELLTECKPLLDRLFGEVSDDDVLDPESPTVPANGSDKP